MSGSPGAPEIEVKLRAASADEARSKLEAAGLVVSRQRTFENNVIYDTADLTLRKRGCVLRLRASGDQNVVTFKGRGTDSEYKVRPETEYRVSDHTAAAAIFTELGYQPVFRYDKYRTEYQSGDGCTATLDETPIGVFIELEGAPAWIDATASRLGYSKTDYITASYGRLYSESCKLLGVTPTAMVF